MSINPRQKLKQKKHTKVEFTDINQSKIKENKEALDESTMNMN